MVLESDLANITRAYWLLSSAREGRTNKSVTFETAIRVTGDSLLHLNPDRRIAHCLRRLEQEMITGSPQQDKAIADASK